MFRTGNNPGASASRETNKILWQRGYDKLIVFARCYFNCSDFDTELFFL